MLIKLWNTNIMCQNKAEKHSLADTVLPKYIKTHGSESRGQETTKRTPN